MSSLNGVALNPAYGRKYQTAKAVAKDFEDGKDFRIDALFNKEDNRLCSIRDFSIEDRVKLRYVNKYGYTQYKNHVVK